MPEAQIKQFKALVDLPDADDNTPEGTIVARFSVFNVRDEEDDVVLPSFFVEGQEMAMAAWGHDWGSLPPAKGNIHVDAEGATFTGRFFMDTDSGVQHYRTVKNMGPLQQWSFGFRVTEAKDDEWTDGKPARLLVHGETYEVSPVLLGANQQTRTEYVKGRSEPMTYADEATKALATFAALIERTKALTALRAEDGRQLTDAHRGYIAEMKRDLDILEALAEPAPEPEEPEAAPEPEDYDPESAQLHTAFLSILSNYAEQEL